MQEPFHAAHDSSQKPGFQEKTWFRMIAKFAFLCECWPTGAWRKQWFALQYSRLTGGLRSRPFDWKNSYSTARQGGCSEV